MMEELHRDGGTQFTHLKEDKASETNAEAAFH